jgi:histidine triad (HIT) family protein
VAAGECIFCKIASGEAKSQLVYQDEHVVAFKDLNPRAPLHVLVIPRRHVASMAEADDAQLVGRVALASAKVAKDAGYGERGFRLVTNTGPEAGQSVPHLHFHVLAGRHLSWPPG